VKFENRQRISGTVDEVERAMLDSRYPEYLLQNHGVLLEVQALEVKDEGTTVRRKIRYRPKPVIKSIGPKEVPGEWFAFVETSTYDKRNKEMTFANVPTNGKISNLLVNTGKLRLRDAGNGQTERTVEGELSVKLPFLMKPLAVIAEKIIQAEGIKILDGEAPVLSRFISDVLRKS
jgi:hypothetical protein